MKQNMKKDELDSMTSGAVHLMGIGMSVMTLSPMPAIWKFDIFTPVSALTKQLLAATSLKS
jgi:hypothetical protein